MNLALTFVSMLPIAALVALVLAAMKREDTGEIVRVGLRHWGWLVGGLLALGTVIQLLTAIVQ